MSLMGHGEQSASPSPESLHASPKVESAPASTANNDLFFKSLLSKKGPSQSPASPANPIALFAKSGSGTPLSQTAQASPVNNNATNISGFPPIQQISPSAQQQQQQKPPHQPMDPTAFLRQLQSQSQQPPPQPTQSLPPNLNIANANGNPNQQQKMPPFFMNQFLPPGMNLPPGMPPPPMQFPMPNGKPGQMQPPPPGAQQFPPGFPMPQFGQQPLQQQKQQQQQQQQSGTKQTGQTQGQPQQFPFMFPPHQLANGQFAPPPPGFIPPGMQPGPNGQFMPPPGMMNIRGGMPPNSQQRSFMNMPPPPQQQAPQ
ncbi:unnamed protein product [Ambrosiozyma monospora]|uniref:Unnamed protein product n=1 Tax=Ambrosiozyma monospora TaxID=43982 RepID=A0A9W7DHB0_AMBMO|nr:unnamed protein product [Ambrosiozyma monospora]